MNRIKARLQQTSESWIATIIMVLNLGKLTGQVSYWVKWLTYSAWSGNKQWYQFRKWIGGVENFILKKEWRHKQQTLIKKISKTQITQIHSCLGLKFTIVRFL